MMALNPKQRPTIDDIRAHAWMQGDVPSYEEIKTDFTRRKQLVDQEAHREREEKRAKRGAKGGGARRGPEQAAEEGEEAENVRDAWRGLEIQDYGPFFVQDYTQFFTTADPLQYFEELNDFLTKSGIEPQIHGDKLSLKFTANLEQRSQRPAAEEEEKKEEAAAVRQVLC